jgi:6-pyruvoyltetrahydropterin/6-carboxytetrahydropterin synthase
MYEVGLSRAFRARHVMPGREGPEGGLHEHDYRIDVVVERSELDDGGMVCDLDLLERSLGDLVARLEGAMVNDVVASTGGVTVEAMARWTHEELVRGLGDAGGESMAVRVWESPIAFGGYRSPSSA